MPDVGSTVGRCSRCKRYWDKSRPRPVRVEKVNEYEVCGTVGSAVMDRQAPHPAESCMYLVSTLLCNSPYRFLLPIPHWFADLARLKHRIGLMGPNLLRFYPPTPHFDEYLSFTVTSFIFGISYGLSMPEGRGPISSESEAQMSEMWTRSASAKDTGNITLQPR